MKSSCFSVFTAPKISINTWKQAYLNLTPLGSIVSLQETYIDIVSITYFGLKLPLEGT